MTLSVFHAVRGLAAGEERHEWTREDGITVSSSLHREPVQIVYISAKKVGEATRMV